MTFVGCRQEKGGKGTNKDSSSRSSVNIAITSRKTKFSNWVQGTTDVSRTMAMPVSNVLPMQEVTTLLTKVRREYTGNSEQKISDQLHRRLHVPGALRSVLERKEGRTWKNTLDLSLSNLLCVRMSKSKYRSHIGSQTSENLQVVDAIFMQVQRSATAPQFTKLSRLNVDKYQRA